MGRSFIGVLVVIALVAGLALIENGRDREVSFRIVSTPTAPTETGDPAEDPSAFGGGSLTGCLRDLGAGVDPPQESKFPGLDPDGAEEIADRVEDVRQLRFDGPVDASFLDAEEFTRRLGELTEGERSRALAERQGAALELLGAIPEGSDLLELSSEALDDQVVGLYVPDTKELLVASSGQPGVLEEITLAHELEHALADADIGLPLPGRIRPGEGDGAIAAQALVEGDATLTMSLYALRYVSLADQLDLGGDPAASGAGLGKLPDFLRRQLLFPYEAGLQFVCEKYEEGGWPAVDAAYEDPPASTAELLGLRDTDPVTPPPSGTLDAPWRPVLRDGLGAASLAWLFAAPGGDPDRALPDPREAIGGWAGDRATLWQRGDGGAGETALALEIVDEGETLCGATIAWYAAANPDAELGREGETTTFTEDDQAAAIVCGEDAIRVGIAPDAAIAERLTS